ncbi:MAG: amidohydrolase family protein [Sneathiella sp.]
MSKETNSSKATSGHTPVFGEGAPYCAAPDSADKSPRQLAGPLSCDTHAHICGPGNSFQYSKDRIYTPPDALPEHYAAQLTALGIERAVLIQPSVYGTDNTVLLNAMKTLAQAGLECRAVAVVDPAITNDELDSLHLAGVRGLRFNLVDVADPKEGANIGEIKALCERVAPKDWHAEFLIHVDDYPDFGTLFNDFPVDIVIGHMGYVRLANDAQSAGFQGMLRLARAGKCWIKLTGPYRISPENLPYPESHNFARQIIDAAPNQIVWGTDWPHVMVAKNMPNDADLLDLLDIWVTDPTIRHSILVTNPAKLYGF